MVRTSQVLLDRAVIVEVVEDYRPANQKARYMNSAQSRWWAFTEL